MITFQGGQQMPVVGTPAYNALVSQSNATQGNVAGTFNPKTQTTTTAPVTNSSTTGNYTGGSSAPVNNYSVVTSQPANQNLQNIQSTYQNTIAPAVTASTQNTAQNTAQANAMPSMQGFTFSPTKTGAQGETQLTQNGQTYYGTPVSQAPTSSDIASILSGSTGATAPSNTTPQTPVQIAQTQTGINPTAENAGYQAGVSQINDQISNAATTFQNVIQSLTAGSIPLTGAQQSLVNATNSAFQQMTTNANLKAAALSSETGGVSNMTNAMGGQLIGIATDQAAAIAKMEIGFQTENYNEKYQTVTAAYDAFTKAETAKMDTLTKIHDSVMSTYQNAVQAAQKQQEFNQTVYHDAAQLAQSNTEFRDTHDSFGNVNGTQAWNKTTGTPVSAPILNPGQGDGVTNAPLVTTGDTGVPDPASQASYLATLPKSLQATVKAIAEYRDSTTGLSQKTKTALDTMAHNYNPNYDSTNYQAIQKVKNDYTSGATHKTIVSLNTSINHAGDLAKDFVKLPSTDITKFNTVGNWLAQNVGSGAQTKVLNDLNALGGELAKTYKGTAGTDQEIANIEKGININSSPEQFKSFIESSMTLLGGRLGALQEGYVDPNGLPIPGSHSLLNPSTSAMLSNFKNNGYDIKVPGVNYTDANSYVKYDPQGAQYLKAVVTQYPNLSQSDALQQAQYNQSLEQ